MNEAICSEIRKRYSLQIGTRTGKRLKLAMGRLNDQKRMPAKLWESTVFPGFQERRSFPDM